MPVSKSCGSNKFGEWKGRQCQKKLKKSHDDYVFTIIIKDEEAWFEY
jgi:hypothetical protein